MSESLEVDRPQWGLEWTRFAFKARWLIIIGSVIGLSAGITLFQLSPKNYSATSVVRKAEPANFVPFSMLMSGMPGDWHQLGTIAATAHQLFWKELRNKSHLETFVRTHTALIADEQMTGDFFLSEMFTNRIGVTMVKDQVDEFIRLNFFYSGTTDGVTFLNEYIQSVMVSTKKEFLALAVSALDSAKIARENELARLRESRDVSAQQSIQAFKDALDTANAAGIEKPALASLGSTSTIITANATMPTYFYGSTILAREMEHIRARIGNDLAIGDFANLSASLLDIERRQASLKDIVVAPVTISELAVKTRPTQKFSIYAGVGLLAGAFLAALFALFYYPTWRPRLS